MNITDAKGRQVEGDRLEAIFAQQSSLMEEYMKIEEANGLLTTRAVPVDIHAGRGQARLKDFAWRITEELAEAVEVLEDPSKAMTDLHFQEEVADALHFLVELCMLSGVSPHDLMQLGGQPKEGQDMLDILFSIQSQPDWHYRSAIAAAGDVVWMLGKAMNFLKNKPWKQTHMLTDVVKYQEAIRFTVGLFFRFLVRVKIDASKITELYFKKAEVNKFRQRSSY